MKQLTVFILCFSSVVLALDIHQLRSVVGAPRNDDVIRRDNDYTLEQRMTDNENWTCNPAYYAGGDGSHILTMKN